MSFSIEENLMLHIRYYKENCSQKWTFLFARLISCHISIANCLQPTISTWSGFSLLCPPSCSEHKPFVVANIFSKPPLSLSFSLADTILPLPVWCFIPVQGYLPGLLYFECILYVTELSEDNMCRLILSRYSLGLLEMVRLLSPWRTKPWGEMAFWKTAL